MNYVVGGPCFTTGLLDITLTVEKTMFGRNTYHDHYLDERDRKMSKLYIRLSLAQASRNKQEVTRITRELKRLGHGGS